MFLDLDWPSLISSVQTPFSELQTTRCFLISPDLERNLRELHTSFTLLQGFCQLLACIVDDHTLQIQYPKILTTVPGAADGSLLKTLCYILTTFAWVYTDNRISSVRGVEQFDKHYISHAKKVESVTKFVNCVAGYARTVAVGDTDETMEAELKLSCAVLLCSLQCEDEEKNKRKDGVSGKVRKEAWLKLFTISEDMKD
ncbi:uncharacterized protein H6S33_010838 [Morchella sextelata]|uniref:uncharacterized protein n=1 Tax=Morchella sextelata TaxID=1174677 RepID=UPI001D048080|nr:uncharacterized protein H6S33_010838 [Morchella sextelata]KAH0611573.1 hypothetical protein H6S33_010838 [Morchella sextelata]